MTILQGLQVKQSEVREKICKLLALETRTEEQDGELVRLTAEGQKIEPEIRAAIVAQPDENEVITKTGDPEQRERAAIRAKTGVADFLSAAASGREVVRRSTQSTRPAVGCAPLNRLPLDIFTERSQRRLAQSQWDRLLMVLWNQPCLSCSSDQCSRKSLGIQMPTHGAGASPDPACDNQQSPADTLAPDAAAPVTAAVIALDSQTSEKNQRSIPSPFRRFGRLPGA